MEFLAKKVLDFWFGPLDQEGKAAPEKSGRWFAKDSDFDREISSKFKSYLEPARMGAFDRWNTDPSAVVALIVLLDQFPRNIYRGHEKSFLYDKKAISMAREFAEKGLYLAVQPVEGYFALMPYMHSEDKQLQDQGVEYFKELRDKSSATHKDLLEGALRYAVAHRDIIARFGRFPHRNGILNRESTREETGFLKQPGSSF